MSLKLLKSTFRNKLIFFIPALLLLSGCSSSNGFFGGGMSGNAKAEAQRWANMWAEKPVVIDPKKTNNINSQITKGDELTRQNMRLTNIESVLQQIAQQQQMLQNNIKVVRTEIQNDSMSIEQQPTILAVNNTPAPTPVKEAVPVDLVQPSTDALGIHLASYRLEENIAPGLNEIRRVLPGTIKSKEARISTVDISGTTYYRLILGPYNSRTAASTDCGIIAQNIEYCNIIDFTGDVVE